MGAETSKNKPVLKIIPPALHYQDIYDWIKNTPSLSKGIVKQ